MSVLSAETSSVNTEVYSIGLSSKFTCLWCAWHKKGACELNTMVGEEPGGHLES
jgi:hypothetical protein